jgi:hypothetical protein
LFNGNDGRYIVNENKRELPICTRAVAVVPEARHGWVKWVEKQQVDHIIYRVADKPFIPNKNTLDDRDEEHWPIGFGGRREDPWVHTVLARISVPSSATSLCRYGSASMLR